jgi:putative transposase
VIFSVSQTWYRYEAKKNAESEPIVNWLLRLTDNTATGGSVFVTSTCERHGL